jgi:hypothetical protein
MAYAQLFTDPTAWIAVSLTAGLAALPEPVEQDEAALVVSVGAAEVPA